MRLSLLLASLVLLVTGCPPNVRPCSDGTLFLDVSLDADTKQADHLQVLISVGTSFQIPNTLLHDVGDDAGGIEVQFPKGYPIGEIVHLTIIAVEDGATLGLATLDVPLIGTCESRSITVPSNKLPDLAQPDLRVLFDLLPPPPDLTVPTDGDVEVDLLDTDMVTPEDLTPVLVDLTGPAGADLTCNPTTEDCFNGIDDDCDGMPDCADPDCNATAICVPPTTGNFKIGTKLNGATSCAAPYPTLTTLKSSFTDRTCGSSGCACSGSADTGPHCSSALMNAGSTSTCGGGSAPVNTMENTCLQVTPPSPPSYHFGFAVYIQGAACGAIGTPSSTPPGFSQTNTFCANATPTTGAGCTGGKLCVAKAIKQCVIAPGHQLSCPSGYAADPTPYFTGHDDARTCSCACTMVGGTCFNPTIYASNNCTGSMYANSCANEDLTTTAVSIFGGGVSTVGMCSQSSFSQNGSSTPTGEQTVCCTP